MNNTHDYNRVCIYTHCSKNKLLSKRITTMDRCTNNVCKMIIKHRNV